MIIVPVLSKDDDLKQEFLKLMDEENELHDELMKRLEADNQDNRKEIIEEAMDVIQVCINILNKLDAVDGEINEHFEKLKSRNWEFEKLYRVEEMIIENK